MRQTMRGAALTACAVLAAGQGAARPPAPSLARRPVVLELFTSQGCSSCPPADALLRELSAARPDVLALSLHVTYWDSLGWRDPFSLDAATARQRGYAASLPGQVYTPQLVIDGVADTVGSDRDATLAAIARATAAPQETVAARVARAGGDAVLTIGAGIGEAQVFVVGYDHEHATPVGRGENGGRTLIEADVVRGFEQVANWHGAALALRRARPPGEHLAVIVQSADGRILAAARENGDAR